MRKNRELRIVFLGIVVLFAVFLVIPALQLLLKSVWGANGLTVEFYASVFAQKGFGAALRNSFVVSAAAAAAAVMLAFVIAYAIHYPRLPRPCKRLLQAAATLPMFLPTITYGFAIIYSFGKQGLITQLLGFQMFNIYGFGGLMTAVVGVNTNGEVTGVAVTDHRETVGVGTQALESGYLSQYTGRSGTIRTSGSNAVEAVSGATATSEAVTSCVNQALAIVASLDTEGKVDYVDGEV